jgi:hypothetical protein
MFQITDHFGNRSLLLLTPMSPSASFCNAPLSSSVDPSSECSLLSLDWVLSSEASTSQSVASGLVTLPTADSLCSMHTKLRVCSGLLYNLVLGHDWLFFCRQTLPHTFFFLSSGTITPGTSASRYFSSCCIPLDN